MVLEGKQATFIYRLDTLEQSKLNYFKVLDLICAISNQTYSRVSGCNKPKTKTNILSACRPLRGCRRESS